jgi:hypothetical protein
MGTRIAEETMMTDTSNAVIEIEEIHKKIFHQGNRDKLPNDYYLVLPSRWISTYQLSPIDTLPMELASLGLQKAMRTLVDVSAASTCFGYELIIDPSSEIKLIPRNGYQAIDTPLPFDEGA